MATKKNIHYENMQAYINSKMRIIIKIFLKYHSFKTSFTQTNRFCIRDNDTPFFNIKTVLPKNLSFKHVNNSSSHQM